MVLVDKKIFSGGLALLIVGLILSVGIASTTPVGHAGMTEDEIVDLMIAEDENGGYTMLAGILVGVGFLLVLISFGTRRKNRPKKMVEKPSE